MHKTYYVYIMTNKTNSTLYTGITNNLTRRMIEHKMEHKDSFTKKYNIHKLIYFEETNDINIAIEREKQIKRWNRQKKENLINKQNPKWNDYARFRDLW